jgi:bifunctional polynucleotide phosphatase/kinase
MEWTENKSYLKGIINQLAPLPDPTRIASFDWDDTLVHVPVKGPDKYKQWKLVDPSIPSKIKHLVDNDYIIVVFTNQGGMSMSKNFDKKGWKEMVKEVVKILFKGLASYYFAIYVAKAYDLYRKPNIGLWQQMKGDLIGAYPSTDKLRISKRSFFVGDAGGRLQASPLTKLLHPGAKKDHSDTDIKFALNIGLTFFTPDEFYTKNAVQMAYQLEGFNPAEFVANLKAKSQIYHFEPRSKELILMVGFPGSGKTDFVQKYILPKGYTHINQDICKTKVKCHAMATEAMEAKANIVIDNTNLDVISRMEYTTLAREHGYKHIRAIVLKTDIKLAKHLNNVRHIYSEGVIPKISNLVYGMYLKKFVKPTKDEFFDQIEYIDFALDTKKFKDPLWKKIFMRWSEA